ncbi:MAG TPA: SLC13 family permease [Clostridia bacterium]|nr:SLC13 family permease [Clostridia bacterium]
MSFLAAVIVFAVTYVLLLIFSKYRAYIALASAIIFVIWAKLSFAELVDAIDFNVLMMIAGTMGIVVLFVDSKMPQLLADILVSKAPNAKWAIMLLALFAGIISAFVDNVATVLMVAPVALAICKKQNLSPVLPIIAIAVSSNLQGAATLVGDTTSILLGNYAGMDFLDFFWFLGKPGIFFVVEIGAVLSALTLLFIFRKEKQKLEVQEKTQVTDYFPSALMILVVVLLIAASFIPNKPSITNGIICMGLMVVGIIYNLIKTKKPDMMVKIFKEMDYFTLLLLAGLFVIIAGITKAGVIDKLAQLFMNIGGNSLFVMYTIIVFMSVLFSAFIDNIPYVATMLPVIQSIALMMGIAPYVLYFGLLIGATLGGNLTPIGASANITGIGILRKEGHDVKFKDFFKIGVPFTLTAVATGYIFIWIFYGM